MTSDICPCGVTRATCEYHADGAVSQAQAIASGQVGEPPARTIKRLCAMGRIAGVLIDSIKVDATVFEKLRGVAAPITKCGVDGLRMLTCNGECEVWRRK